MKAALAGSRHKVMAKGMDSDYLMLEVGNSNGHIDP
jgi:hypothetical protein